MAENKQNKEYCIIGFQMRYRGEDFTRSGMKQMWIVFQARKTGPNNQTVIKESTEIPIPANVVGTTLAPQKDNPSHVGIYQNLLQSLQIDGWKPFPQKGGDWWERRFWR
jgi:hypothetical protein